MHPRKARKQSIRELELTGTTTINMWWKNEDGETSIIRVSQAVSAEGYSL